MAGGMKDFFRGVCPRACSSRCAYSKDHLRFMEQTLKDFKMENETAQKLKKIAIDVAAAQGFLLVGGLVMRRAFDVAVREGQKISATLQMKVKDFEHPMLDSFLQDPF
ncbi:unnamed protein product [Arabidopsis halleri]